MISPEAQKKALFDWVEKQVLLCLQFKRAVPTRAISGHIRGTYKDTNKNWWVISDSNQDRIVRVVIDRMIDRGVVAVVSRTQDDRLVSAGTVLDELAAVLG